LLKIKKTNQRVREDLQDKKTRSTGRSTLPSWPSCFLLIDHCCETVIQMIPDHDSLSLVKMYYVQSFLDTIAIITESTVQGRPLLSLNFNDKADRIFYCTSGTSTTMCSSRAKPFKWVPRGSALLDHLLVQLLLVVWVIFITARKSSTSRQIKRLSHARDDAPMLDGGRQDAELPCRLALFPKAGRMCMHIRHDKSKLPSLIT
jgi:hypothetical protein